MNRTPWVAISVVRSVAPTLSTAQQQHWCTRPVWFVIIRQTQVGGAGADRAVVDVPKGLLDTALYELDNARHAESDAARSFAMPMQSSASVDFGEGEGTVRNSVALAEGRLKAPKLPARAVAHESRRITTSRKRRRCWRMQRRFSHLTRVEPRDKRKLCSRKFSFRCAGNERIPSAVAEILEVTMVVRQNIMSERIAEQIVHGTVPHPMKEVVSVAKVTRFHGCSLQCFNTNKRCCRLPSKHRRKKIQTLMSSSKALRRKFWAPRWK